VAVPGRQSPLGYAACSLADSRARTATSASGTSTRRCSGS